MPMVPAFFFPHSSFTPMYPVYACAMLSHSHIHLVFLTPFLKSFRADLMEVVRAWASGSKFIDVCKITDAFEGSIIRAIRRLEV